MLWQPQLNWQKTLKEYGLREYPEPWLFWGILEGNQGKKQSNWGHQKELNEAGNEILQCGEVAKIYDRCQPGKNTFEFPVAGQFNK